MSVPQHETPTTPAEPAGRPHWRAAARLAYIAAIALATLSNLGFEPVSTDVLRDRLVRGMSPAVAGSDAVDALRNLLLFAGWGLVWCMTAPTHRLGRSILVATVTGMLLSMTVEAAQLFSERRTASILDVITNTSGAFLGAVATVALLRAAISAQTSKSCVGIPMFVFAVSYGCVAALEILLPGMRQELLAVWGGPFNRFQAALGAMGWGDDSAATLLLQFVLMMPAGAFAVAALAESGRSCRRALVVTALGGVVLSLVLEFARGLAGQPIELGMFVAHALGVVSGAWVTAHWLPTLTTRIRGRSRPVALLTLYTLVLLLWRWRPFVPHLSLEHVLASFSPNHLVPLQALTLKMDLFSASVVAVGFLLHLPLGALLAVWPLRSRGWLAHVLPGLWIVIIVELGQLFIAGRYFDVTDIIIGAGGVLTGWALMRRAGFHPHGEALPER
jgi:glycopeptide antibiotics resistance protein